MDATCRQFYSRCADRILIAQTHTHIQIHTQKHCPDTVTKCPPQLTDNISKDRRQFFWCARITQVEAFRYIHGQYPFTPHHRVTEGTFPFICLHCCSGTLRNHLTRTCILREEGRRRKGSRREDEWKREREREGGMFHLIHSHSCISWNTPTLYPYSTLFITLQTHTLSQPDREQHRPTILCWYLCSSTKAGRGGWWKSPSGLCAIF